MRNRTRDWFQYGIFTGISWFIGLSACAGDGLGLDEFGEPVDSSGVADSILLAPIPENIQANIFSAICAVECHRPPNSYQELNLEAGKAYENLVDVPSVEIPSMMRVLPGDADNSYIIWKLEGRAGIIGQRMPFNLPALPSDQIEAIKAWINDGATQ